MHSKFFTLIFTGILCIAASVSGGYASETKPDMLMVTPSVMHINAFFSGGELTISGNILSSEDVLIEIKGKDSESSFDMKGRVGPFWMTTGNVELKNIPEFYQLLLPPGTDWEVTAASLGMGINHLKDRLITKGTVDVPADIFKMFADLKDHEGLYKQIPNAVSYLPGTDNTRQFTAVCHLPDKIKTGTYEITASFIKNNVVQKQMKDRFSVDEIGFIKLVNHLAMDQRVIYGVSAVIIALLAGLLMGILFKQTGDAH